MLVLHCQRIGAIRVMAFIVTLILGLPSVVSGQNKPNNQPISEIEALPRIHRVDVLWHKSVTEKTWRLPLTYEIQRAEKPTGPFRQVNTRVVHLPMYSDFIGKSGVTYYYRVRSNRERRGKGGVKTMETSTWSKVVSATTAAYAKEKFLTELQEAGFRYFYHHAHPVSGMALEGVPDREQSTVATGATGMGLFNLAVGVRRGFITREQGAARVLKILTFLHDKAERFHGAFPHWMDGATGKARPFSPDNNGADLVETAFLAQSFIMMRESFTGDSPTDTKIRNVADKLWRDIEWDFIVKNKNGRKMLVWHWSPTVGFKKNLGIGGFSECQIVYLMALASPTHQIGIDVYRSGWEGGRYSKLRTEHGVDVELGRGAGGPLFFIHYSYMGMDPRAISYRGKTYFEHFKAITQVQKNYALSKADTFKGYDEMWGLTSSTGPDGYRGHSPNRSDNGTIAPTAALSSMPYLPDDVYQCAVEMFKNGKQLWGPMGFYDAFNPARNWVSDGYLGIDVGPIGPMIENHRTGMCWAVFMRAPEVRALIKLIK